MKTFLLLDYVLEVVLSFLSSLRPLRYYKAKKHPLSFPAQCMLESTLSIYQQQAALYYYGVETREELNVTAKYSQVLPQPGIILGLLHLT